MSRETYENYSAEPEKIDLICLSGRISGIPKPLSVLDSVIPYGALSDGKAAYFNKARGRGIHLICGRIKPRGRLILS